MAASCPACGRQYRNNHADEVPSGPIARGVLLHVAQSDDTINSVAKRAGYYRPRRTRAGSRYIGADSTTMLRRLGLATNKGKKQKFMTYISAVRIIAACPTIDPVDVGL